MLGGFVVLFAGGVGVERDRPLVLDPGLLLLDRAKVVVGCGGQPGRPAAACGEQHRSERDAYRPLPGGPVRAPLKEARRMPLVQHASRQIHLKVVYYGPGLGGKTTNLEFIHKHTKPSARGRLISLHTEAERTLFFDLLPMDLGQLRGYTVRLHLCTVPGQMAHEETRRLILRHVDGIVFVCDSQEARIEDNLSSIANLYDNLALLGIDASSLPVVVQYNKRDLDDSLPVAELQQVLGIPSDTPAIEASAVHGGGVFQTLKEITKACLHLVGDPAAAPEGRSPSILPGRRASMFPGGRPPLLDESAVIVPGAARVPAIDEPTTIEDEPRYEDG